MALVHASRSARASTGLAGPVSDLCSKVEHYCGPGCRQYATRAGGDASQFRSESVLARRPREILVAVVGDSVARSNDFGVGRGLVDALQRASPESSVKLDYAQVAGGFEPDHLYQCGLSSKLLVKADVVMVQYHAPKGGQVLEKIVRSLLSLPRKPLVVYVSHCLMQVRAAPTAPHLASTARLASPRTCARLRTSRASARGRTTRRPATSAASRRDTSSRRG